MTEAMAEKASFVRGYDKRGRPAVYVISKLHSPAVDRASLYQWVSFQLDEVCARADSGSDSAHQFVALLDAGGVGLSGIDVDALKYIFRMLAANYPERLGRLYILNDNFLFRMAWKVVQYFIDPRTARKIQFLGGPDVYTPRLLEDFAADQLWAGFGGAMAYEYEPAHITSTPSAYITVQHGPFPPKGAHRSHHGGHGHGHGHGHGGSHGGDAAKAGDAAKGGAGDGGSGGGGGGASATSTAK